MNLIVPCIHGDPSKPKTLESWTRRLLVVETAKKAVKNLENGFRLFLERISWVGVQGPGPDPWTPTQEILSGKAEKTKKKLLNSLFFTAI